MTLNQASAVSTWPSIGTLGKDNSEDWGFVEKSNGTFNWTSIDNDITTARSHGVSTFIYSMLHTPSWASPGGGKNAVPSVTDYDNFLRALVTRYKGQIQYYELWNEPNNPNSWAGTVKDMLNLAKSAFPLIKSIDSNAVVLTPGVAVAGVGPLSNCVNANTCWLANYLQEVGGNYADAITWHAYRCQTGQYGDCNNGIGCVEVIRCAGAPLQQQISLIESYLNQYGLSKPLIDTEGGWGQNQYLTDPNQQAAYISRWYVIQASEDVRIAAWYAWNGDALADPTGWGTLWTQKEGESPAAKAYNLTYNWLVGASFTGPCSLSNSLWSCKINLASGNQGLILWADSNSSLLSYTPASQYKEYQDLDGQFHQIQVGSTIQVSDKPILLQSANTSTTSTTSSTSSTIPEFNSAGIFIATVASLVAVSLLLRGATSRRWQA